MPADRAKVLAALNTKFKGKSVDKNYKESIATKWAAKITDDEAIDEFINDREDDVLEYMKAKDAAVTTATAKAKQDAADAIAGKKPETQDDPNPKIPDDVPEYMKAFMKQMETLAGTVTKLQTDRQTETITQRFQTAAKEKGLKETWLKGRVPQKEEDFDTALTELLTDYKDDMEALKLGEFGNDTPPGGANGNKGDKNKVDPDIVAFGKKQNEAATTQKQI